MVNNIKKLAEFTGHTQPIYTLEAAPEPGCFFSAGGDKTVVKWNILTPDEGIPVAQFRFTVYSLCCIHTKNILLAGTSEGGIHIIDLNKNEEIKYYMIANEGVFDIKYSSEHNLIAASTSKGQIIFLDPESYSIIGEMSLGNEKVRNICFNPNRPYLYAASSDTHIYIIDIQNKKSIHHFQAHQWATNALFYHSGKDELVSASKDAHIRIWDLKKQFELVKSVPAHNYAIYRIAYNPVTQLYATASRDKTVKIWSEGLDILYRIDKPKNEGHTNSVNALQWMGEKTLLTAGDDRLIVLWEIANIP